VLGLGSTLLLATSATREATGRRRTGRGACLPRKAGLGSPWCRCSRTSEKQEGSSKAVGLLPVLKCGSQGKITADYRIANPGASVRSSMAGAPIHLIAEGEAGERRWLRTAAQAGLRTASTSWNGTGLACSVKR